MRFGRVVLDADVRVRSASLSRDSVRLSGNATTSNLTKTQLLGLRDAMLDTTGLVSVAYPVDPSVSGFYRCQSVSVDMQRAAQGYTHFDWSSELERLGKVDFESVLVGANLLNDHGYQGVPWHAAPASSTAYSGEGQVVTRASSDGNVAVRLGAGRWARWSVAPDGFYTGAARLSVAGVPVTGLDAPEGVWSLSNGIVGVSPVEGGLTVTRHGQTSRTLQLPGFSPASLGVAENTPERVRIRLTDASHRTVYLGVRRGAAFFDGTGDVRLTVGSGTGAASWRQSGGLVVAGRHFTSTDSTGIGVDGPFMVGRWVDQDGDRVTDLLSQWVGYREELVRPRRR